MVKLLGGRVAEEIEFGVISTGAADDMYRVTNMAKNQVHFQTLSPTPSSFHSNRDAIHTDDLVRLLPREDWALQLP